MTYFFDKRDEPSNGLESAGAAGRSAASVSFKNRLPGMARAADDARAEPLAAPKGTQQQVLLRRSGEDNWAPTRSA
jgi:hypothetical protein